MISFGEPRLITYRYTHIDTARVYGTEPAVGAAIKASGIDRSRLFITTKLWNNSHAPEDVEPALDASLKDLGMEYVDLYLMHWPSAFKSGPSLMPKVDGKMQTAEIDYVDTYKAMEKLLKNGKTKAIGVSNFSFKEMERLLEETSIIPAAHQLELHPWLQQKQFMEWHKAKGIHITQYSPFGNQNEIYDAGKNMGKLMVYYLDVSRNGKLTYLGRFRTCQYWQEVQQVWLSSGPGLGRQQRAFSHPQVQDPIAHSPESGL